METKTTDFIQDALQYYWHKSNMELVKDTLGDIERTQWESIKAQAKRLLDNPDEYSTSQYKSRIEELEGLVLLPDHYTPVQEPFFEGKGVHSVSKLEDLCEGYKEYCHQLQIKFQKSQQTIEYQRKRIETLTGLLRSCNNEIKTAYSNSFIASQYPPLVAEVEAALNPLSNG